MAEYERSFWGEGLERHVGTEGLVDIRKFANHDLLLKVFCNNGKHLVAVIRRGLMVVTRNGTTGIDKAREIECRCMQAVTLIDPVKLSAIIDPAVRRPRSVRLSSVSRAGEGDS